MGSTVLAQQVTASELIAPNETARAHVIGKYPRCHRRANGSADGEAPTINMPGIVLTRLT
jgi:hypothetical protein